MKISLGQFNRIIKEAAIRKSVEVAQPPAAPPKKGLIGTMDEEETLDPKIGNIKSPDVVKESQRGNDENSQHDNDTEPGDPNIKRLKEAALRDLRLAEKILKRR